MIQFRKKWSAIVYIIGILLPLFVNSQSKTSGISKIPLTPAIRHGVLSNGLQYYIMRDSGYKKTINMRLVVNVGARDQDDDQLNMAHLVEHLAFKATKHFPMGVKNYFESKGLVLGSSFSGVTRTTYTEYFFTIPSNDSVLLHKGFLALYDYAGGLLFLPADVEEARYEVRNEAAAAITPDMKYLEDLHYRQSGEHVLYKPGLLEKEMKNAISAPAEALHRFYHDWYHPIYQAIFIVGDIDESKMEHQVKKLFTHLSNTGARKKANDRSYNSIKLSGKDKLLIAHPSEGSNISIEIYKKQKDYSYIFHATEPYKEYKMLLMRNLINEMLDYRLQLLNDKRLKGIHLSLKDLFGDSGIGAIVADNISVNSVQEIKVAIFNVFKEFKRIAQYGFLEEEFIRAREVLTFSIERQAALPFDVRRLVQYYTDGKAVPANEDTLRIELLAQMTSKEINNMVTSWLKTNGNTDIIIKAPSINKSELPTEQQVLFWMKEALRGKVSPYAAPLKLNIKPLPTIPLGVTVGSWTIIELDSVKAKKIILPNGATVILKSIPSSKGYKSTVLVNAIGTASLSENKLNEEFISLLENVGKFTGIGSLNADDLELWKQEKGKAESSSLWVNPYIRPFETGIEAKGKAELVLQLINLYMTRSIVDEQAYKGFCKSANEKARITKRPIEIFSDTIAAIMGFHAGFHHPLSGSRSKLEEISQVYKKQFSNAADFTFVITGSFDQDEMLKMVARYIGPLPGSKATLPDKQSPRKQPRIFPGKQNHVVLVDDSVGNVIIDILFEWRCELNPKNRLALDVISAALHPILFKRLREQEKGIYDLTAGKRHGPSNDFFLEISFQAAPENVDRLVVAVKDELNKLAVGEWERGIFDNAVASVRSKAADEMKNSSFWANCLAESVRRGSLNMGGANSLNIPEKLTPSDVTSSIDSCLNTSDYIIFKLL